MASVQSHSTEGRNPRRPQTQRVRKLLLEGKALGCLREGTMRLCWALFRFRNQNFIGELLFFLHKIGTHPWKCPECEGMPQHLQRPSACICVHWKGEAPHQGKHTGIFLVSGCGCSGRPGSGFRESLLPAPLMRSPGLPRPPPTRT